MGLKTKANLKRRKFTKEFKLKILAEQDGGMGLAQLARKYQIHPNTIRGCQHSRYDEKSVIPIRRILARHSAACHFVRCTQQSAFLAFE